VPPRDENPAIKGEYNSSGGCRKGPGEKKLLTSPPHIHRTTEPQRKGEKGKGRNDDARHLGGASSRVYRDHRTNKETLIYRKQAEPMGTRGKKEKKGEE